MRHIFEEMKVILSLNEEQKVVKDKVMNGTVKVNPKQKKLLFIQEAEDKRNHVRNMQLFKGTYTSVRQHKDGVYAISIRLKANQITGKVFSEMGNELAECYIKLSEYTK